MLKIAWSPLYNHPLPQNHRFPMEKYDLIPEQLIHEGTITKENLFEPQPMDEEVLLLTHTKDYFYNKLLSGSLKPNEIRKIGFPYSPQLIEREISIMFGSIQAALFALEENSGIAFNIAGGTHHAYADRGEGFCLMNDIAVAANYLLHHKKASIKKILVIDLDVHQGNGTAALFENNPNVFTFSMHGEKNYPMHKERSDLDIGLPDGTDDALYLSVLEQTLVKLIETEKPDFIFYQSGVDILSTDKLGRMNISKEGCKERDNLVLQKAKKHEIPLTAVMGGGYSPNVMDVVEAHCNLYRLAVEMYS
jgi:acetoin utilization deacetylase AcuC-like enzyme